MYAQTSTLHVVIGTSAALLSIQTDDPPRGLYGSDDNITVTTRAAAYTAQPDHVTSLTFLNQVEHSVEEFDPAYNIAMTTARRCHSESQLLSAEPKELARPRLSSTDAYVTEQVYPVPYYQSHGAEWRGSVYMSDYFPPTAVTGLPDEYSTFAA